VKYRLTILGLLVAGAALAMAFTWLLRVLGS